MLNFFNLSAKSIPSFNEGAVIVNIKSLSDSILSSILGGKYEPVRLAKNIANAINTLSVEFELAIKSATKINKTEAKLLHIAEIKYFSFMRKTFFIVDREQSKNLSKKVVIIIVKSFQEK